ncbi:amidophosphoribosyltransferase [Dysgonomonas sp. PH5-45]|uniref:amidophosphoribosyltransferase n=1 Tax=unclassified Dysgonomonas TaxID=2630389 RepID=UPI002474059E|nr:MULTISPECIES: amidophosphoribosyltransferase [unclassified Dysgonomonas]MDH6355592.1 amidophosphoribosyltransferase [Dysgonomonas sp. PH5-45]MDH6388498.1 amidophosphoribosyltransferase [Dysgonomonas sp. PH5-37]
MTEPLKHECGIAMIRLLKPLEYYQEKYGTWQYGLNKLYLLMEKQHNRGQEGAGLAVVKMDVTPGKEFIFRERAEGSSAISKIFSDVHRNYENIPPARLNDVFYAKENLPFTGELFLGHLRYSTTGKSGLSYVHPFLRRNNWISRNLVLAGNFNMTNVDELFNELVAEGQHPREYADTFVLLEKLGHGLDREVQYQYDKASKTGASGAELNSMIEKNLDLHFLLNKASTNWDGGFVICGLIGCGDAFAYRDPWGIRPAFYYQDEEIVVVASERPVIQTTFNLAVEDIKELDPGQAIIIKKDGAVSLSQIQDRKKTVSPCSFERIYFSRGSDADIYRERKELGKLLLPQILKSIDNDIDHTVFSFIPNTAEVAFYGMTEGVDQYLQDEKQKAILSKGKDITDQELAGILSRRIRTEKVAIKDIKLRTFIAQDNGRDDLAAHVYDITYNSIDPYQDNLVVIDDSIVRGTTLKQSIIKILDRLNPKKIVIVSSSPQIRYPDCYGIDMSRMTEFAAFRAAIELLKENNMQSVIDSVYKKSAAQRDKPKEEIVNYVKEIYAPFTDKQISDKIAEMLTPKGTKAKVEIIFQSVENLHKACPNNKGDWYFSGNYPTPGGMRMVNTAFLNYIEGVDKRSY